MAEDFNSLMRAAFLMVAVVVVLAAIIVPVIVISRKTGKNQRQADWSRVRAELSYLPKCPKCGQNMKEGFILAGRGIHWRDQPTPSPAAYIWSGLENTANMGMRVRYNRAWHCDSCKVLTVDHTYMLSAK